MSDSESASDKQASLFASPHYVQTMAAVLGLSIRSEWESSVVTNLVLLESSAELVLSFDLPDDLEPAVVFVTS